MNGKNRLSRQRQFEYPFSRLDAPSANKTILDQLQVAIVTSEMHQQKYAVFTIKKKTAKYLRKKNHDYYHKLAKKLPLF